MLAPLLLTLGSPDCPLLDSVASPHLWTSNHVPIKEWTAELTFAAWAPGATISVRWPTLNAVVNASGAAVLETLPNGGEIALGSSRI